MEKVKNNNEENYIEREGKSNKRKDLTGKKFGKLTVTEMLYNYKHGRTYVKCKCECGNTNVIRIAYDLKKPGLHSCGCARKEVIKNTCGKDINGKTYGRLTVVETYWESNPPMARCNCSCGTKNFIARKNDVQGGHTKSCGCLQKDTAGEVNEKDWTNYIAKNGIKFIKKYKKNKKSQWLWECECPYCNNKFYELPARINNNHVQSCGCQKRSIKEKQIEKILDKHGYNYEREYSFENLKSDKNYRLRFDFAIKNDTNNIDCLIEYDGQQHYKPVDKFGGQKAFEQTQYRDQLKNKYCQENGIKLIRIPYTKNLDEIEDIIINIHKP